MSISMHNVHNAMAVTLTTTLILTMAMMSIPVANALHVEDVGKHDFVVSTAGHGSSSSSGGGSRWNVVPAIGTAGLSSSGGAVLTTGSTASGSTAAGRTYEEEKSSSCRSSSSGCDSPYILGPSSTMAMAMSAGANQANACYLSSRSVETGQLLWRRNVCSSSSTATSLEHEYASSFSPDVGMVHTLDGSGTLRGWDDETGSLVFDVQVNTSASASTSASRSGSSSGNHANVGRPKVFGAAIDVDVGVVGAVLPGGGSGPSSADANDEVLALFDARTGKTITPKGHHGKDHLSARQLLSEAKVKGKAGGSGTATRGSGSGTTGTGQEARVLGMTTNGSILVGYVTAYHPQAAHQKHDAKATKETEWVLNGLAIATLQTENVRTTTSSEGETIESSISVSNPIPVKASFASSSSPILYRTVQLTAVDGGAEIGNDRVVLTGISPHGSAVVALSIDVHTGAASGAEVAMATLHPHWTAVHSVHPPTFDGKGNCSGSRSSYGSIAISGTDSRYPQTRLTTALFRLGADGRVGEQIHSGPTVRQDEETEYDVTVYCSGVQIVLERKGDAGPVHVKAFEVDTSTSSDDEEGRGRLKAQLEVMGDAVLPTKEAVIKADLLSCSSDAGPDEGDSSIQILVQTTGKMTALLRVTSSPGGGKVAAKVLWTAEEALAKVTDSIFLDETANASSSTDDDEEEALLQRLSLSSRLSSQMKALSGFVSGGFLFDVKSIFLSASGLEGAGTDSQSKERNFGFAKVAVLLAPTDAVFGMDVSTSSSMGRGSILWKMALPPHTAWSKIIHGGQSSKSLAGGGQDKHGVHSHEITIVSYVPAVRGKDGRARGPLIVWKTLDGLTGKVFGGGSVDVISPVAQIVPIYVPHHDASSVDSFRHAAVILHEDESATIIPDSPSGKAAVAAAIDGAGRNGLFTHTINRNSGSIKAYRFHVSTDDAQNIIAQQVGGSAFIPEQETIVSVAYPRRNEIVQSPARILGDDSLLLSYLNPHLSVVITVASSNGSGPADDISGDTVARALSDSSSQKAKPLGATKPGEESPPATSSLSLSSSPDLFVNLVDTVSGRILHRAAHSDATTSTDVPVLISENWVFYAFSNLKSRRTEIGVMSLHEGMIDKQGITAFSSPDQELTFSSFTSPKPIVLAKTYTVASSVTALGVTTTKEGISSKQILMASGEGGQLVSIDRRMLDPRRPTGQIKDSEKKEGLHQYHPLIPVSTLRISSYSQRIESVTSIVSTATNIESQSLFLAHGGPDLFFTRLSPSRGFDLLPDSFARALLSMVVVGLCFLVASVKGMSTKKMTGVSWA